MKYKIIGTETYEREISKLDRAEKEAVDKIPERLSEDPYIGKPLGYYFLREKRIREKRIYYLVYEELKVILLVATSSKRDQQRIIDFIKDHLSEFKKLAEEASKQAF